MAILLAFDNLSDLGRDHAAIKKSLAEKARPTSGRLCALCSTHDDFKLRDASQLFLMTTCSMSLYCTTNRAVP